MDVYPSLTYRDLAAALEFLQQGFGLRPSDVGMDDHGAIRYAVLKHGEGAILLQPDLPEELHGSHLGQGWVYVTVADPDAHFARAKAAGVEVLGEPHDAMEGTMRGYSAHDLEGNPVELRHRSARLDRPPVNREPRPRRYADAID